MTDRIVEIAEGPVRLHVKLDQLVIERDGQPPVSTPLAEMAALVLSNPSVQMSQAVLAGVAQAGGSVVICDRQYLPAGMMLPLQAHFLQTERLASQAEMSQPLRKRCWQQIVRAKIRAQSALLHELYKDDGGLKSLMEKVRSGDPDNCEAQAARRYWPQIFSDPKFRRDREAQDQNRHLNYGYTVLRALVTRALCGAGLHPSFGLQHQNRYDPFSLAADVMEPFRPLVDRAVVSWIRENDANAPLDPKAKAYLIGAIYARYEFEKEERTLFDVFARTASQLAQVIAGKEEQFTLPEVRGPCAA
jgi:CRISPR-associated protein Cas1